MTAMYTIRKGGAYDRFIMMLEALLERNCEIHCLSLTPIQIKHPLFRNHVMYFPFRTTDGLLARFLVLSVFPPWCVWIAWKYRINLLLAFGSLYAFIQAFSKWFLKKPMVTFIRGRFSFDSQATNSFKWRGALKRGIENVGLLFSDRVITNNSAVQEEILKNSGSRSIEVQVLYNNILPVNGHGPENISETRHTYRIPGDAKVVVTAAILNPFKNIEIVIRSLSQIEMKSVYLLIAGEGSTAADQSYKLSLQELTRQLGVDKRVRFPGWLEKDELRKVYAASDLFVLPSLSEGMPNAMLEALGAGLPCVGSNIAGVRDILGYDELLFDPRDEKALTRKIRRAFSDSQFFARIKELCQERKRVFEFDWKERVYQIVTTGVGATHH